MKLLDYKIWKKVYINSEWNKIQMEKIKKTELKNLMFIGPCIIVIVEE